MRVDEYTFGRISIDGVAYAHDVVIEGGTIRRRKKRPSKPRREELGHTPLTPEERVRWRAKHLWVGTGARARLPVPDDFCEEARRRGVELLTKTTPELVKMINEAFPADTNVILHVHLLIREARSLRRGSRTRRHPRLNQNLDAGSAGGRVGCESASQFSREYSRRFGAPPQRDIKRMRLI
jgi:hypothetical protein